MSVLSLLQKIRISRRLYIILGLSMVLVVLLSLIVSAMLYRLNQSYAYFDERSDSSRQIQINFKIQVQEWKDTLLRGYDPVKFEKYSSSFFAKSAGIQTDLKNLSSGLQDFPEIQKKIEELIAVHKSLEEKYRSALLLYDAKKFDSAKTVDILVTGIDRAPTKAFDEIVLSIHSAKTAEIRKIQYEIGWLLIGSSVFILLLLFVLVLLIIRSITVPLNQIASRMTDIAEGSGDLTVQIQVHTEDELASLAAGFNTFVFKVRETVKSVLDISTQLSASSAELSASSSSLSDNSQDQAATAEEISASIEEVSAMANSTSESADQQTRMINELVVSLQKLDDIINENEKRVNLALQMTEKAASDANSGDRSLVSMNRSIGNITDSSKKITGIVEIINSISDQINLLSLNAAIEAARAGDAGRGFAVVADEISKLADQTSGSLKEIGTLININNQETSGGMQEVLNMIGAIGQVTKGVNEISSMMHSISDFTNNQIEISSLVRKSLDDVRNSFDQIKLSTDEQKTAFGAIAQSITNVTQISQSNATSSEELTANSEELSSMSELLHEKVTVFKV